MKSLYIECKMGAAGDMLMGALYELLPQEEQQDFLDTMNRLFGPDITVRAISGSSNHISGTRMEVKVFGKEEDEYAHEHHHEGHEHHHEDHEHYHEGRDHHHEGHDHHHEGHHHHGGHEHNSYQEILHRIGHLDLPEKVKADAGAVYKLIGDAESKVHQTSLEHIHFHEVGSLDALADVVGCCWLMDRIGAGQVTVSPVCVGNGQVRCAHGILPVPAPATAEIIKGMPSYASDFDGELLTPTGAALLKHFADNFGGMPVMEIEKTGYGVGTRQYAQANCVRLFLGNTVWENTSGEDDFSDTVTEISCNLDDMTAEATGALYDTLLNEGALDVWTVPICMKKSRSGIQLNVLCKPKDQDEMIRILLEQTTTQGVRYHTRKRQKLKSRFETVETKYGKIAIKISEGRGIRKIKPEYEDVVLAAGEHGVSFMEVSDAARNAFENCRS